VKNQIIKTLSKGIKDKIISIDDKENQGRFFFFGSFILFYARL
jgi:hypothetical protein